MTKYLYHYTNVDTLELILRTGKFRFTSLSNVDDLNEEKTADFGNFGRFCYVSCWTENEEESIPIWNMYTEKGAGVRIRMPRSIFSIESAHPISEQNFERLNEIENFEIDVNPNGIRSTNGLCEIEKENKVYFPNRFVELFPVTYTKDKELIIPKIMHTTENNILLNTTLIGRIKEKEWEFQFEWRYKLFAWPYGVADLVSLPALAPEVANTFFSDLIDKPIQYNHLDIPFELIHLNKMEVLTDCNFSEESQNKVEKLKQDFPQVTFRKSKLNYR